MKQEMLNIAQDKIIKLAKAKLKEPSSLTNFTGNEEADSLINDLSDHPHAFVLACIMDRQIKTEKAWLIPYELSKRLGFFDFERLSALSEGKIREAMNNPTPLHWLTDIMPKNFYKGIRRIESVYGGDASHIWSGKPSSSTIVRRFLEFDGVGLKIATMAANILFRDLRIPVRDKYSIDISTDTHIIRVFKRLGFVGENASNELIIYTAREIYPEYPGIIDPVLWEIGGKVCHPQKPMCNLCEMADCCEFALTRDKVQ